MLRLTVNPGTWSAWQIPLPPGVITLGRGPENSFPIEHPSVSHTHCQLTVTGDGVVIKDLGSINGTFVNDTMVDEARLANGQKVRIGSVEMEFERGDPAPAADPEAGEGRPSQAAAFCKFHLRVPARFFCPQCRRSFCDLCVSHRQAGYFCRACSVECTRFEPISTVPTAPEEPFFRLACRAFKYPFEGDGKFLLVCGGIFLLVLDAAKFLAHFAFLYGFLALLFLTVFGAGYLTGYLQNILNSSASGGNKMPDWPDLSDFSSDVTSPFLQLAGLVAVCFAPAIILTICAAGMSEGGPWLGCATTAAIFFGAVYFPMAFMAVAIFGSLAAVNPLLIIPSIVKIGKDYAVAMGLFVFILVLRWLGQKVLPELLGIPYILPAIIGDFFGLYLLVVEMRILGLLYLKRKDDLGWSNL